MVAEKVELDVSLDELRAVVSGVEKVTDTAAVRVGKEGLYVSEVDPSKVILIQVSWNVPVDLDEVITFLVDFYSLKRNLTNALRLGRPKDGRATLTLARGEKEDELTVRLSGGYDRIISMALRRPEEGEDVKGTPKVEFKAGAELRPKVWANAVGAFRKGEKFPSFTPVTVRVEGGTVTLSKREDREGMTLRLRQGDGGVKRVWNAGEGATESTYSLDLLMKSANQDVVRIADGLVVELATNKPMRLAYSTDSLRVTYYLANYIP
jgi:hypothetical protein